MPHAVAVLRECVRDGTTLDGGGREEFFKGRGLQW